MPESSRESYGSKIGVMLIMMLMMTYTVTCISDFRRGFESVSRFIGHSPGGTTINYNTFNLTVTVTLRNYEQ
jgi:hypothetical protein